MMKTVVGVTGQIGSGKSTILEAMEVLYSIPYFDSDRYAKNAYFDPIVRATIIQELGFDAILPNGQLNKSKLIEVLNSPSQKRMLERVIHAAVKDRFLRWKEENTSDIVILESAILFSSGFDKLCDITVSIQADQTLRQQRVLGRDPHRTIQDFINIEEIQQKDFDRQNREANIRITNNGDESLILLTEGLYQSIININNG